MRKIQYLFVILLVVFSACTPETTKEDITEENDSVVESTKETESNIIDDLTQYGINPQKAVPTGLVEGDLAPDFEGVDQNGNKIILSELIKEGSVVLFFYRGNWCPYCNKHLVGFQGAVSRIIERGATVIAVAPETPENVKATVENIGIEFSIISDNNHDIVTKYNVGFYVTAEYAAMVKEKIGTNISEHNGTSEAQLPIPATYIIGSDGKIAKIFFNSDYKIRASVEDIDAAMTENHL